MIGTYNPYLKKYNGTFSIIYEDEKEIEEFEIGKNINESAELVSKAFNNDVNSIVKLNSGLSLKLLIRILNINNILK